MGRRRTTAEAKPPRRAKGTGTIYQRSDGLWIAEITIEGERLRRTAATQKLAERRLRVARQASAIENADDPVAVDYIAAWVETAELKDLVRAQDRGILENRIKPALGDTKLRNLTAPQVRALLNGLAWEVGGKTRPMGPSSKRNTRSVISGACSQAVEDGLLAYNPAASVKVGGVPSRAVVHIGLADARRLVTAVEGHKLSDLWLLLLFEGLRLGEALGLDWADVNLQALTMHIHRTDTRVAATGRAGLTRGYGTPKSWRGTRVIPILDEAKHLLRRRHQLAGRPTSGLVFPSVRRAEVPYPPSRALSQFGAVLRAAGMEPIRQHDLRHWCATILIGRGVPLTTVALILGDDPRTVATFYAGVFTEAQQEAASRAMKLHLRLSDIVPDRRHTPHPGVYPDRPHPGSEGISEHE